MTSIDFKKIHENFDGLMPGLCKKCGGKCEKTFITAFLPGEIEFISNKMGGNLRDFTKKFCSTIKFGDNDILIAKIGICPFLDKRKKCLLEKHNCKILFCLLYPVSIKLSPKKKIKIFVDSICPMNHRITREFKNKGMAIYRNIRNKIPGWWLEFVSEYDINYDYSKLEKLRNTEVIQAKELKNCIIK